MHKALDVILSLHLNYADAILKGTKTVELRRKVPRIVSGTLVWLYATQPTGAVLGAAKIKAVDKDSPSAIWMKYFSEVGLDRVTFDSYFSGASEAIAIILECAERTEPVSLERLRTIRSGFHPPQVLTRLSILETAEVRKCASYRTS